MFLKIFLPIVLVAAIAGSAYLIMFSGNKSEFKSTEFYQVEAELREEVTKNIPEAVDSDDFLISNLSGNYARVSVGSKNVFLFKAGTSWKVLDVADNDEVIYCEKMERYGFPASFISDCSLQYPKALTVSDAVKKAKEIAASLVSSNSESSDTTEGNTYQIIGIVSESEDPDCGCFYVTSGDETVTVYYEDIANDDENDTGGSNSGEGSFEEGDQVVITGTVNLPDPVEDSTNNPDPGENNNSSDNGVTIDATDVEEIYPEIGDTNSPSDSGNSDQGGSNNSNSDESEDDITNYTPATSPSSEPSENLFDIDNSSLEIKIIGN